MPDESAPAQISIDSISLQEVPATSPDLKSLQEANFYAYSKAELEVRGMNQDLEERKKYAKRIFVLICCWLAAMFILLLLQGFGGSSLWSFKLTDPIVLAAIGSTTINVLGIFYVVTNYLFPKKEK